MSAVKIPNVMPITPTKTANHSVLIAGDRGANISNKREAIGQIDADTAHTIPRPRNESVKTPGIRSARLSLNNPRHNAQQLASSTRKNERLTALHPQPQNELRNCISSRG